jgi:hypothetical protein
MRAYCWRVSQSDLDEVRKTVENTAPRPIPERGNMRQIRPRSAYDVLALISFFLVIGGGTALASYIVSSNSQIGPGTVSGHKPPSGDHSNIIGGSVNGQDLATNSVNSAKVTDGSLLGGDIHANTITGSNLNATSVAGTLQLQKNLITMRPTVLPEPQVLFNQGNFELTADCVNEGGGVIDTDVHLIVKSGAAFVSINHAAGERFTGTEPNALAATATSGVAVKGGEFSVSSAGFVSHLSGQVLAVADDNASDFGGDVPVCQFSFEGIGQ